VEQVENREVGMATANDFLRTALVVEEVGAEEAEEERK
jgi:hypothetical protein